MKKFPEHKAKILSENSSTFSRNLKTPNIFSHL